MIRNIINLTKIFLLSSFKRGSNNKKKEIWKKILYPLLVLYLIGVFGFLSYEILNGLILIKQSQAFIGLVLMAIISLVLFTTIISTINVLYFSNDNRFILPLPFKPIEVLTSKLNILLVYVYLEEAMFGLVPMVMYGIMCKQPLYYYPLMLLVLLLVPILPLLVVVLIVICIMAITKGIRNKNLVQMLTATLSIIFSLFISVISSSSSSQEDAMQLMNKAGALVEVYKKAFITMPLAINTLINYDLLSLLLLFVISIIAYVIVCVLPQKLYYRGMLGSLYSSSGVSNKKLNEDTAYNSKGLLFTYVLKEMKVYLRNPTFFVQLILPCILLPVFLVVISYFSVSSQSSGEFMRELTSLYTNDNFSGYIFAGLVLAIMFLSLYCFISMVAISKDGSDAYMMKYIPVAFYKQIIYKMIPDVLMNLTTYLVSMIAAIILFKLPINYVLLSIPIALSYSIAHGFLILSDVRRPKLYWTNEIQVCKNNLRMIVGFVFSLISMALVAILGILLHLDKVLITLILSLLYIFVDLMLYRYIKDKNISLADGFE